MSMNKSLTSRGGVHYGRGGREQLISEGRSATCGTRRTTSEPQGSPERKGPAAVSRHQAGPGGQQARPLEGRPGETASGASSNRGPLGTLVTWDRRPQNHSYTRVASPGGGGNRRALLTAFHRIKSFSKSGSREVTWYRIWGHGGSERLRDKPSVWMGQLSAAVLLPHRDTLADRDGRTLWQSPPGPWRCRQGSPLSLHVPSWGASCHFINI